MNRAHPYFGYRCIYCGGTLDTREALRLHEEACPRAEERLTRWQEERDRWIEKQHKRKKRGVLDA